MNRAIRAAALVSVSILLAAAVAAQVTTATFYGTVVDPSGASIPGAAVTLTHKQTGATALKSTGATGDFQFDFLRAGTYSIQIDCRSREPHLEV